jgi:dTDP-4-dehydrorhamnose reductase
VLGVKTLAEYCAHKRIKLVHISTDYIYSEMSKSKEENHHGRHHAVTFPCDLYGLQKLLGE